MKEILSFFLLGSEGVQEVRAKKERGDYEDDYVERFLFIKVLFNTSPSSFQETLPSIVIPLQHIIGFFASLDPRISNEHH